MSLTPSPALPPASAIPPEEHPQGLEVVSRGVDPIIDIVAIHGLNGHREKTWTADNGVHWLRSLLPNDLPNARILCWGYDANTHSKSDTGMSQQYIYDHALNLVSDLSRKRKLTNTLERPIIFIAHSLGGIVLKSALIHSDAARKGALLEHRPVKLSTYGIFFMGTPHQGGNGIQLGSVVANVASVFTANDRLLKHLERDSEWLQQQLGQYGPISGDFVTKFAYEEYKTPTLLGDSIMVVPKASAVVPGQADAEPVVIHADHISMVKFPSKEKADYVTVAEQLRIMAMDAEEIVRSRWEQERRADSARRKEAPNNQLRSERPNTPPNPLSTVIPFRRDLKFVPRGDLLARIHRLCSEPAGRVALVGLGGVGKSQLAIEFAYQIKYESVSGEHPVWVFWVHAGTTARIEESFKAIAEATQIPGRDGPNANIKQLVYDWLSNETRGRWCMILDSADDYAVFFGINENNNNDRQLATYLPQSRNGSILVTTRNRDLAYRLTDDNEAIIPVGAMTKSDALQLLENKLGEFSSASTAADLVQALEFIPLAISQAAAYIKARPRITLAIYLAEFEESEKKRVNLLEQDAGDLRRDEGASNAILTTWWISFDYIRSERNSAGGLLSLMSFFNRQGIPGWLLKSSRQKPTTGGTRASQDESAGSESESNYDEICEFEEDVKMLMDFFLVIDMEGDMLEMHGLVQLSTRRWLKASGRREVFRERYIALMAESFPSGEYETWESCKILFPHAEEAVKHRPQNGNLKEIWSGLLGNVGRYALGQGMYGTAEQMLNEARKVQEERLGREAKTTLTSMSMLGLTYRSQGRWEEAEKLGVQVMETRKMKLGADHTNTLASMNNLASTFWQQGRWEEAEKLFVQVMETRKMKLGADHTNTLTSMNNLASTFRNQGQWEEAEKLFVQVMEACKMKLGADHPDTLTSMNNLAFTWKRQSRHDDALALVETCAQARQQILGIEHPKTISSLSIIRDWNR